MILNHIVGGLVNKILIAILMSLIICIQVNAENNENLYLIAEKEYKAGNINEALWIKSLTLSEGDKNKAKYKYISLRVEQLADKNQENSQPIDKSIITNKDSTLITNESDLSETTITPIKESLGEDRLLLISGKYSDREIYIDKKSIFSSNIRCRPNTNSWGWKRMYKDRWLGVKVIDNMKKMGSFPPPHLFSKYDPIQPSKIPNIGKSYVQWRMYQCKGSKPDDYVDIGYRTYYAQKFAQGIAVGTGKDPTYHGYFNWSDAERERFERKIKDYLCKIPDKDIVDRTGKYVRGYSCPNNFGWGANPYYVKDEYIYGNLTKDDIERGFQYINKK